MSTRKEKRAFIRALVKTVTKDVLAKVPLMPPEWDGQELREYLADQFTRSCTLRYSVKDHACGRAHLKRLRASRSQRAAYETPRLEVATRSL